MNFSALLPEAELLLGCTRTQVGTGTAGRVQTLLQGDLDWPKLMDLAGRHKVKPLLFWNLRSLCPEQVLPEVLAQLKENFQANAWLGHHLGREMVRLVKLLEAHAIRAIPLKGVVLAASVYGDLSLRHTGDIDLLVSKETVLKAKALLVDQGFNARPMTAAEEAAYLQEGLHFELGAEGARATVELHWDLLPQHIPHQFDFEAFWQRTQPVTIAGTTVPNLSPDDMLLYLCVHGAGHRWSNLRWLCDIAELVRLHQQSLDWANIIVQARATGLQRMLLLGLLLSHQLLDAPLPETVWTSIKADRNLQALAAQETARLFQEAGSTNAEDLQRFFYYLRILDHLGARARYLRHILAPYNTAQKSFSLPTSLSFLYYFLRPLQFSYKYARTLLK
jgi:hypothetical protein